MAHSKRRTPIRGIELTRRKGDFFWERRVYASGSIKKEATFEMGFDFCYKMQEQVKKLSELVQRFRQNQDHYKNKDYGESATRLDFIDQFFEVLGWDVSNREGYAEQYREVVVEPSVSVNGQSKNPDYVFRVGGVPKFFVEAKKPSVSIKNSVQAAFQVRRYGFSGRLPLCVLTDFEEFSVYDTRIKPNESDSASVARGFYCTFDQYNEIYKKNQTHFEYIYEIFSKNSILKGNFDRYALKKKGGTSEVDKEFLKTIESWRIDLAKNLALRNKNLSVSDLNEAVQVLIDRIIFLHFAIDKNMEDETLFTGLYKGESTYKKLDKIFAAADKKYNSGLFKRNDERAYLSSLQVDDKTLQKILTDLSYEKSPYTFSVIPIEILGKTYEQFLGQTIRLTPSHQARVEQKPEVQKAGGIYYTPQYIVDAIIKNTVGEKLKNAKPENCTLKIVDPSCGSGSFLVGVYSHLLAWYLQEYSKTPQKTKAALKNGKIYEGKSLLLTIEEKRRILLEHIYGVDIDPSAVEVSKLSLLLKLMEDENTQRGESLFKYSDRQILPNLQNNIKCGNSLIGSDFYTNQDLTLFDDEKMAKVNVFDWEKEFPSIFDPKLGNKKGFDCIVGNPPYIRIQNLTAFQPPEVVEYLKKNYDSVSEGNIDIYVAFIEQILTLLNQQGLSGYILPHKFFQADMGANIRELLSNKKAIRKIINFHTQQIFENATTYTCLLFLSKNPKKQFDYYKYSLENIDIESSLEKISFDSLPSEELKKTTWNFYSPQIKPIMDKIENQSIKLENIAESIFPGIATSADKIYVLHTTPKTDKNKAVLTLYSKSLEREIQIEKAILKPFLMGKDVKRYEEPKPDKYVIFPYQIQNNSANLIDIGEIQQKFPKAHAYLEENKKDLKNRERGKFKKTWWQFGRPQNLEKFEQNRIITQEISYGCNMTLSESGIYHTTTVYSFIFEDRQADLLYFLALLNSKMLWFFLSNTGYVLRGGYFRFKTNYLKPFGIPQASPKEQAELGKKAQQMLEWQKKLPQISSPSQKKALEERIQILDSQIDAAVYKLYRLTPEEIKVVEES